MASRTVRIGSLPDAFQYDDTDFNSAIETDHYIKSTQAPSSAEDMVRLGDLSGSSTSTVHSDNPISDNAIVRGDGGTLKVQESLVTVDDSGNLNIPTATGYKVNSIQVVTDQQATEPYAGAVSSISLASGSDTVDRATFNTDLATLVNQINAIKNTLNNVLAKIKVHGLIA